MHPRYRLGYIIAEDPSSYQIPTIEPVHIWNSSNKDIVSLRKNLLRQWIFASIELWTVIFLISTIYFGSGSNPSKYTDNLDVNIIDYDGDLAGYYFTNAFRQTASGNSTLHWCYKDSSDFNHNVDDTQDEVQNGKVWAAVVLRADTTRLINQSFAALANTTTTLISPFISTLPILVIYGDGRNTFTVNTYVLPPIRSAIAKASAQYGQYLRSTLIHNLSSSANSANNYTQQLFNTFQIGSLLVDPLSASYQNIHPGSPLV
ncbi:unnamed protein product, partial [Adineta ricciae]